MQDIEAASMQKNCGADNLGADILGDMSINDEALGGGEVSGASCAIPLILGYLLTLYRTSSLSKASKISIPAA